MPAIHLTHDDQQVIETKSYADYAAAARMAQDYIDSCDPSVKPFGFQIIAQARDVYSKVRFYPDLLFDPRQVVGIHLASGFRISHR